MLRRVASEAVHARASSAPGIGRPRRRCRPPLAATACAYSSTSSLPSSSLLTPACSPSALLIKASAPTAPAYTSMLIRRYHASPATAVHALSPACFRVPRLHHQQQQQHQQRRHLADNLLGHSPMARPDPRPKASPDTGKPLIGVDSNTAGGGVWAQTSAKRDKLAELKLEIPSHLRTLDDVATPAQRLDLDLADGLRLVARAVDGGWADQSQSQSRGGSESGDGGAASSSGGSRGALAELQTFLGRDRNQKQQTNTTDAAAATMVGRDRFEAHLSEAMRILEPDAAAASPSERLAPRSALARLRDFTVFEPEGDGEGGEGGEKKDVDGDGGGGTGALPAIPDEVDSDLRLAEDPFDDCAAYLRLLTARHAAALLRESWDDLTRLTDGDVDRAAVRGDPVPSDGAPPALALEDVNGVLEAYAAGSCRDRVAALWRLVDKDKDGLIDEAEMDYLAHWSMKPVEAALQQLFEETLEELPSAQDALAAAATGGGGVSDAPPKKSKGWRQRRRDAKTKKRMLKLFNKAVTNHFDIEVETPHRLRCIYAWAEKAHQNNRVDSVHIESGTIAGRKRYVELAPKLTLEEFRSEQQEHFGHLDRVGEEILSSFREDLLVEQGKGRQNKQERRDMLLFLGAVSAVDAIIWSL